MTESDRTIRFTFLDFDDIFVRNGIDPDSLTEGEWSSFENMFLTGTNWDEVADTAAWTILMNRKNQ